MKLLITGCGGQLGEELQAIIRQGRSQLGEIDEVYSETQVIAVDVQDLDITSQSQVEAIMEKERPDVVINCAAYTAVDKAESDEALAEKINAQGPENLAKTGIPLIHVSTDYVFDGTNCRPYAETDAVNPQSVYGKTKLAGEQAVLANAQTAVIIRTAWLYSTFGNNFVKTMRKLGKERDSLNVVFYQVGSPTYARDLAQAIVDILPQMKPGMKEVYHFSNEGVCSWYDFATAIMAQSDLVCDVFPIESKDYPTPAKRPHYSVLNKGKIKKDFGIKINHWAVSLAECVEKLENGI